jgi:hypothetical protein
LIRQKNRRSISLRSEHKTNGCVLRNGLRTDTDNREIGIAWRFACGAMLPVTRLRDVFTREARSQSPHGQAIKTGSHLRLMRRLFGELSDEGLSCVRGPRAYCCAGVRWGVVGGRGSGAVHGCRHHPGAGLSIVRARQEGGGKPAGECTPLSSYIRSRLSGLDCCLRLKSGFSDFSWPFRRIGRLRKTKAAKG